MPKHVAALPNVCISLYIPIVQLLLCVCVCMYIYMCVCIYIYIYIYICKGKSKGHPRTGHEGAEGKQRYSSTLSLNSALDGVGGQRHAPTALTPGKRPGTHLIGGMWVPGPV